MSVTDSRLRLAHAEAIAADLVELLAPACERIEVAGSIRRRKPLVKDIELVAIAKTEPIRDLFGDVVGEQDLLDKWMRAWLKTGHFEARLDVNGRPRLGPKTKLLLFRDVAVDLFTATPDNWGWIYLLRTGPGEFNTRIVTQWHAGGKVMPFGMRSQDGSLWRGNTRLSTPEEIDAFAALGMEWIRPEDRR